MLSNYLANPMIIRADATTQMGIGHVMRCLSLAQVWQNKGGQVTFMSHCESDALHQRIVGEGFRMIPLEKSHPDPLDLDITLEELSRADHERAPDIWLVLDGYHFDPIYQASIRGTGTKLLVIDDFNHLPRYHADILLNQNIESETFSYVCDSDTICLFGPKYTLLRSEFLAWKQKIQKKSNRDRKILVTLGGADPNNVTLKVVRALRQTGFRDLDVNIVAGPANPNLKMLEREIENAQEPGKNGHRFMHLVRDANMPELMARSNFAISAGGSTCWELCFFGVPTLTIVTAKNQLDLAQTLHRTGAAVSLGWHEDVEVGSLAAVIEKLLNDPQRLGSMSLRGKSVIDGLGSRRILTLMQWFLTEADREDIQLRKVSQEDTHQLWRLANDKEVRQNSFNPKPITYEHHLKWFEEKLKSSSSVFYVLDVSGVLVAQIRYDKKDETADIDYAVIPSFRGKSLGTRILDLTWENACRELGVRRVRGVVKEDNKASIFSFLKAGFEKTRCDNYSGFDCVFFEKRLS